MGGLTSNHKRGKSVYLPHYSYIFDTHISKKQKTQPFMDTYFKNSVFSSSSSYSFKAPSLWNKFIGFFKKEESLAKNMGPFRDHNIGLPAIIPRSCCSNGVCENEGSCDKRGAELFSKYASTSKSAVGSIRFLKKDERVDSVDKVIDLDEEIDSDEDEVRIIESGGVNLELGEDVKVGIVNGVIDLDKDDGSDDDETEIVENRSMVSELGKEENVDLVGKVIDLDKDDGSDDDETEIVKNRSMISELEKKENVDLVGKVIDLDKDDGGDDDETEFIENGGETLPLENDEKDDLVNEVIDLDKDDDDVRIVENGGMDTDMELEDMGKILTTLSLDSEDDSVSELPVHTLEPFVPLTNEEKDEIFQAFSSRNRRNVLVTHENANIDITGEILQCLKAEEWLNDEVVNVYFHLLKEREAREPKKFLKCHFFNTFFYKKLISGKSGYDYKSVRRWTTQKKLGYNLSECDIIFVPIHKQAHWCLAVINKKDRKFQYLDSLGGIDTKVLKVLAMYYADELKDKNGVDIDVFSWTHEHVKNIPLQKNGSDCGMFMIKYADFYSRGLGLCFNQKHMPYFRWRTAKEILRLEAR